MTTLPIIDVKKLLDSTSTQNDKKNVGDKIKAALEEFGFFYISNHNCNVTDTLNQMKLFFDLPLEEKEKVKSTNFHGWSGLGSEVTKGKKDWHECFEFMAEQEKQNLFSSPNKWPNLPNFKEIIESYITNAKTLGRAIMESISLSYNLPLDSPIDGLYGFNNDPFWMFRLLNYPVLPNDLNNDSSIGIGIGEHTDYGCLTFVYADKEGLEIKYKDKWINMPIINDYLVCNIGDMLSYWTRNLLKATPHRVIRVKEHRQSIAFFFEPNFDTIVRPLIQLKNDNFAHDDPIHYGTYLESKYQSLYPHPKTVIF